MQSSSNEQLNEIKTQLITREGIYRLMPHAEYSRPKTSSYAPNSAIGGTGGAAGAGANSTHVRISFTKVCTPDNPTSNNNANPFLPTTYYTPRMSHSNEGLNHIGGGNSTPPSASPNVATTTNQNNSSNAYHHLNHHMNNDHMNDHSQHLQHNSNTTSNNTGNTNSDNVRIDERICFNIGREIFIYAFNGLQPADLTKLVDRRSYKQTSPTCHDICSNLDIRVAQLLVGFNAGQIQMIDLYRGEVNKFYNQERFIEKSKVTCIRWLPRSKSNFLVAYATGQMYLYKEDLTCGTAAPNYQHFKTGEGFTIYTCKTKSSRNPIFRWSIGEGAIHEFSFSPCGEFLAVVSQDGFLRVFHYDRMELVGRMRSYFGGLLCVGWSPDSRFIVTGGEDDLITVWSHTEKRVIARGQGHKSWVNVVTFDPYMTTYNADSIDDFDDIMDDDHSFEDGGMANHHHPHRNYLRNMRQTRPQHHDSSQVLHKNNVVNNKSDEFNITSYRIGSVGQDTQLCLWDLTDDVIRQSSQQPVKSRTSLVNTSTTSTNNLSNSVQTLEQSPAESTKNHHQSNGLLSNASNQTTSNHNNHSNHHHHHNSAHQFFNSLIKSSSKSSSEHKHHKTFSLSSRSFSDKHAVKSASSNTSNNTNSTSSSGQGTLTSCTGSLGSSHHQSHHNSNNSSVCDPGRLLGTMLCPRLDDVPMLEPHVCKKVAYERLTSLVFRKDYFVIANQDGKISIYARPNKLTTNLKLSSQNASMASDVNDIACDDNSSAIV